MAQLVKAKTKDGQEVEVELPEGYGLISEIRGDLERDLAQRIERMRERALEAELIRAATAAGVKPFLLKKIGTGDPPIVAMFRPMFGLNEDDDAWYVKKGDRFAFSANAAQDGAGPFMSAQEYFAALKSNPEHRDLFQDERQGVAGSDAAGGGTVSKSDPVAIGRNLEGIASGKVKII